MNLERYGLTQEFISAFNLEQNNSEYTIGRIIAQHRDGYELVSEFGLGSGKLKSSIYYTNGLEEFPVTGDFVVFEHNAIGDSRIIKTLPRKSFFSRRDPDKGRGEQAVAANFDYAFIMQSLNQDFNLNRLERYMTVAWQSGATPVLVLTKADLVSDWEDQIRTASKVALGANIHVISVISGIGLETLQSYLQPAKTVVFLGSSGVGKSSLVNTLAGQEIMTVSSIREDDAKGRHTTTHRQLVMLECGSMIIDTPGMRELGLWDTGSGLSDAFHDVEQYFPHCRFSDCQHNSEPGCAVQYAIEEGELPKERWESYLNLKKEVRYAEDRAAYMKDKQKWAKDINKWNKQKRRSGELKR